MFGRCRDGRLTSNQYLFNQGGYIDLYNLLLLTPCVFRVVTLRHLMCRVSRSESPGGLVRKRSIDQAGAGGSLAEAVVGELQLTSDHEDSIL